MRKIVATLLFGLLLMAGSPQFVAAQNDVSIVGSTDLSFEFQAYPTGLIPGIRLERNFGQRNAAHLRLGYQLIDHRDLGKHSDETGSGYGLTLGYKRYFKDAHEGFSLGLKTDLWFNAIDWIEEPTSPSPPVRLGSTDIIVLQPTLEGGYLFTFGPSWVFTPSLAFGFEWNISTKGEPTGEGAIVLLGFSLGKRF